MKLYDTTTRSNFESHVEININSLNLAKYVSLLPAIGALEELLDVSHGEYLTACSKLKLENSELLDIEYFTPNACYYGILVMDNAAVRRELDAKGNAYYINYSAYVVPSQYTHEVQGKLIRYFLEKRYPEIFLHPDFIAEKTVELSISDMTLAQIIAEYGNMTYRDAKFNLPAQTVKKYVVRKSKFKIYSAHASIDNYEIYLEVNGHEDDSLYIPFQAIIQKKYSLVKNRQIKYFTTYYANQPAKFKRALAALRSPEAKLLKQLLNPKQ